MISSSIDGSTSNGSGMLIDLLNIVTNPDVYGERIKTLQTLIAQSEQVIALAGAADEVLALREAAKVDRGAAADELAAAKAEAEKLVAEAKAEASNTRKAASLSAANSAKKAIARQEAADEHMSQAQALMVAAEALKADAVRIRDDANQRVTQAEKAILDANAARDEALAGLETFKKSLVEKYAAFVERI